jgi:uncharacterized protein (TIGR03067 family)
LILVAACGARADAEGAREKQPMDDQEIIQGTWSLVSGERNGTPLPNEVLQLVRLIFDGNKLTTKHRDQTTEATFKLDPAKSPREIDVDMEGSVGKGIYLLDGDSLKIIHGEVGSERPMDLAKGGHGLTVLVLRRDQS